MSSSTASNKNEDSQLSLTGMATQLGINAAIAVGVLCLFNILRPNNSRMPYILRLIYIHTHNQLFIVVYAPKYKYATKTYVFFLLFHCSSHPLNY